MTSPAPTAPRRSYQAGYWLGDKLRLLPFAVALACWGGIWLLLLLGLVTREHRSRR